MAYFVERARHKRGRRDRGAGAHFRIRPGEINGIPPCNHQGAREESRNTDLAKHHAAKVDGRTYWRVFATKDIQYGEALRIPYRDKRHVAQIKNEIQQKQSQVAKQCGGPSKQSQGREEAAVALAALGAKRKRLQLPQGVSIETGTFSQMAKPMLD